MTTLPPRHVLLMRILAGSEKNAIGYMTQTLIKYTYSEKKAKISCIMCEIDSYQHLGEVPWH